jgi:urease accessory protein
MTALVSETPTHPWKAELALGFQQRNGKTVLAERRQLGPLTVQRAFYPEAGLAHLYILHPPGGVAGGDDLAIQVDCANAAEALLTTPAAGKFYRSEGALARQSIRLRVAANASLEWLPQETLLFSGANAETELLVELHQQSRFIGWDMACLGMPECGEGFVQGSARFRVRIECEGKPLLIENLQANHEFALAAWGLRGNAVMGALYAYPFPPSHLDSVQALWENQTGFAATLLDNLLVCRGIAPQAAGLRTEFERVWHTIRPLVIGREACLPRVWAT